MRVAESGKTRGGTKTAESIRAAAVDLFFEHGYEATTLRQIAEVVQLQVGSLYNHIPSKEELLFSIMSGVIEDLIVELDERLAPLVDPVERLRTAIRVHVEFHTHRAREVFIGNSELRSLTREHHTEVVKLRDRYEEHIVNILESGAKAGVFTVDDPKLTSYAIVTIGTQIGREGSAAVPQATGRRARLGPAITARRDRSRRFAGAAHDQRPSSRACRRRSPRCGQSWR